MSLVTGHQDLIYSTQQRDSQVEHTPLTTFNISFTLTAQLMLNSPAAMYISKPPRPWPWKLTRPYNVRLYSGRYGVMISQGWPQPYNTSEQCLFSRKKVLNNFTYFLIENAIHPRLSFTRQT